MPDAQPVHCQECCEACQRRRRKAANVKGLTHIPDETIAARVQALINKYQARHDDIPEDGSTGRRVTRYRLRNIIDDLTAVLGETYG